MAFCRLVFTVLLISVSCYGIHVPVYMWGDLASTPVKAPALESITEENFSRLLKKELVEEPVTVFFVERTLSTEDLSSRGEKTFPFLEQNLGRAAYLPSVDEPVTALKTIAGSEATQIDLTEDVEASEIQADSKFLLITFNDATEGESRKEMLQRHDGIMAEVFRNLQQDGRKVVGVYTGKFPSWVDTESHSRQRRQAEASNETDDDFILDSLRLYVELLELREGDNTINLTGIPTSSSEINGTIMNTTVQFGEHSFVMNFRTEMGYWFFDSVSFKTAPVEDLHPSEELFAIIGFSYRCGQKTTFTNLNSTRTLVFNNLQIQPFFTTINSTVPFGDTFDCVGFFTGPIWASLFVTFIILLITFYGIMMMMDIRTMDRFDDPKGKTITINAGE